MKGLKYVLFIMILSFISLSHGKAATCIYDSSHTIAYGIKLEDQIVCRINSNQLVCSNENELKGKNRSLRIKDFKKNNLFICPDNIYTQTPTKLYKDICSSLRGNEK